jgi:GH15 family glucan-1,4-alpha-glucosidase
MPPPLPVSAPIEDYALIGNCETAALVSRGGSIDWLCMPRFDSAACMAALLGESEHGRWLIRSEAKPRRVTRRYRPRTLVLETEIRGASGDVLLIECMSRLEGRCTVVRLLRGLRGRVKMEMELVLRFDYGAYTPWVTRLDDGRLNAVAGPDRIILETPVELEGRDLRTMAEFEIGAGEEIPFVLSWSPSHQPPAAKLDAAKEIETITERWENWSKPFKAQGPWSDAVLRSVITLKALTHFETGGIVAAVTTSLPEQIGGARNWDYRFCWIRDATFTLYALLEAGFREEAKAWREWLLRAVAGSPSQMQTVYGVAGERLLPEWEVSWLPGYQGSAPVRVGNDAFSQLQLDVYGELTDALYQGWKMGLDGAPAAWDLAGTLIDYLEKIWREPDEGIWEIRGAPQHFTHSKVMAWVAFDRAVRSVEELGFEGPVERWRELRDTMHREICAAAFNSELNSFVQFYGSHEVDASLLLLPLVGFLPHDDPRIRGTVAAIEKRLVVDGFVLRYETQKGVDGLPPGEGAFLACSFWLADNYAMQGRRREARALFERLLAIRNDVGLLAEEYDPVGRRQLGNFPQAFSHVALVNTAYNLMNKASPATRRGKQKTVVTAGK